MWTWLSALDPVFLWRLPVWPPCHPIPAGGNESSTPVSAAVACALAPALPARIFLLDGLHSGALNHWPCWPIYMPARPFAPCFDLLCRSARRLDFKSGSSFEFDLGIWSGPMYFDVGLVHQFFWSWTSENVLRFQMVYCSWSLKLLVLVFCVTFWKLYVSKFLGAVDPLCGGWALSSKFVWILAYLLAPQTSKSDWVLHYWIYMIDWGTVDCISCYSNVYSITVPMNTGKL